MRIDDTILEVSISIATFRLLPSQGWLQVWRVMSFLVSEGRRRTGMLETVISGLNPREGLVGS